MNDFYKIANEILQIPEENLSWEERLNELVKFRAYLKEYYDSYNEWIELSSCKYSIQIQIGY